MEPRIRPYLPGDGAAFHAAAMESVRELEPWMPWCGPRFGPGDADGWVARQVAAFPTGSEFEFVIIDDTGALLGGCGVNQLDLANLRANLGYWIRSSATRNGYATKAVRLLVAWALEHTVLHRIEVVVAVENTASLRVAEKSGAQREGTARGRLFVHGVFHDAAVFSFVRGENTTGAALE